VARILVVEDSADNMKLFLAILRLQGHEVEGLGSGAGLLETIERFAPSLVLMDIQLPDSDGFALLKAIRKAGHTTLPVVALTAHAMTGDMERAIAAGFNGYVTKPIDVRAFPGQVANALLGGAGTDLARP
jgi:two-component system, cell cycle response regulator DivK